MRRQGHGILADCTPLPFSLFSRPSGRPHSGCVWRENELAVNFWYSELPLWILGKAHRTVILIAIKAERNIPAQVPHLTYSVPKSDNVKRLKYDKIF